MKDQVTSDKKKDLPTQNSQSEDLQYVELYELLPDTVAQCNDWWRSFNILSEDVSLDPPRKPHSKFIVDKLLGWHREYLCDICQYMVM